MDNNEFNRRLRYALQLDDHETLRLTVLGGVTPTIEEISAWRTKEQASQAQACPTNALYALLNGLILDRRGPPPNGKPSQIYPPETPENAQKTASAKSSKQTAAKALGALSNKIDNNWVLKQLRIALSLKTDDVYDLIKEGGGKITNSEINAFFRKPDARNYRRVGDQVVRWFLNGLVARHRD